MPMRRSYAVRALWVGTLSALFGCTSTGVLDPNLPERLLADATCLTELAGAGLVIAFNPAAGGATAVAVLGAIHDAGATVGPGVMSACAQTLEHALADAQGMATRARQARP